MKVCKILQLNIEQAFGQNLVLQPIVRSLMRITQSLEYSHSLIQQAFYIFYIAINSIQSSAYVLYVSLMAAGIVLAFFFDQRCILLAPYGCPLILSLLSISGWRPGYVYLEPVRSCGFHVPPIYMMCIGDYGNPEACTSFSAFRRPSIKSIGTFLFSLSVQMKLLEKLVGDKRLYIHGLCVAIDKPEKSNPRETLYL